jgi:hypothetical protein
MNTLPLLSPIEIIGVCIFSFIALVKLYRHWSKR